jgi:hypothetical protein
LLKSINKLLVISAEKIPSSVAAKIELFTIVVSLIRNEEELCPIKKVSPNSNFSISYSTIAKGHDIHLNDFHGS